MLLWRRSACARQATWLVTVTVLLAAIVRAQDNETTVHPPAAACADDPSASLTAFGGCAAVVAMGCDTDLNTVNPAAPAGTFVSALCPV
eukprot:COSAG02_NODE_31342_length_535_cov_0.903670_1_plen_88_part_10